MLINNKQYQIKANIAQRLLDGHRKAILAISIPSACQYSPNKKKGIVGLPELYYINHKKIGSDYVYSVISPRAFKYLEAVKIPLIRNSRLLEAGFILNGKSEYEKSLEIIDNSYKDKIVIFVSSAPTALIKSIKSLSKTFDIQIKTLKYNSV